MIESVKVTNHLGETITIELRFPEKSGFLVRGGIDGLGPGKATVNTTEVATMDGAVFNSARANKRNIVLNLDLLPNPTVEDTRQKSYKYFPLKRRIDIEIETENRVCITYGYVESNEPNIFSKEESTVISVICPDSWLYSAEKSIIVFSGVESMFTFPFSNESLSERLIVLGEILSKTEETVFYTGDAAIGVVVYIHALGTVENLRIINRSTQELMTILDERLVAITGSGIIAGDDITISTVKGDKYITLQRGGEIYNILNSLDKNYSWFHLEKGDNIFVYTADSGIENLQFRIENRVAFEGV